MMTLRQIRALWLALPKRRALVWTVLFAWMAFMTDEMQETSRQIDMACKTAYWNSGRTKPFPEWQDIPCLSKADIPWPPAVHRIPTPEQLDRFLSQPNSRGWYSATGPGSDPSARASTLKE